MTCEQIQDMLGPFLDGELSAERAADVQRHAAQCQACAAELESLYRLARSLQSSASGEVPDRLWGAIEAGLDGAAAKAIGLPRTWRRRPWLAVAASLVFVVGLGLFGWPWDRHDAEAATIDFAALLDGLQHDAVEAFDRFLAKYGAAPATVDEARAFAPALRYDLPAELPGGFVRTTTFVLKFGDAPGVAARYDRGGEFLGVVFHPPVLAEQFGTHEDRSCVVGKHRGHAVPVGEWSLVHLTDPTTCHCVLSRLDASSELPAIMAAVAPHMSAASDGPPHEHP